MGNGQEPVVVEEVVHASVGRVWQALTDPEQMRAWYFDNLPEFEPVVGFQTRFVVEAPDRQFVHNWEVTEVVPERKLAYTWSFDGISGRSTAIFELVTEQDATRVRVTCVGLETLPADIPEFAPESCRAGWEYFLGDRLKPYVEGS